MNSRIRNALLATLSTLIVLIGAELVARFATSVAGDIARSHEHAQETWLAYSPTLGWERRPGFHGEIAGEPREFDANGYLTTETPRVVDAGSARRVLFFGDSNTFGFGVKASEAFPEQVERRVPGLKAINLGVIGYSSYQGSLALQKYLPILKPDLVVVSFGFNDRRYVMQADAVDDAIAFERAYSSTNSPLHRIAGVLEFLHLYRALRHLLQLGGVLPHSSQRVHVGNLSPRVDEAAYRRNLARIAEQLRRARIPLVFVVLKDNPLQTDHTNRGITALERNDPESAIAYLASASTSHLMFSNLARVYLARAFAALGDGAKANAALASGELYRSFSGGTLIRRDVTYNEIMRQVAHEYGATVVEAGETLDQHPSVYFDYCHFNAIGHRLVADLIAPRAAEMLGLRLPVSAK